MVRRSQFSVLLLLAISCLVLATPAFSWGDCDHRANLSGDESADGAERIVIQARAGDLDVRAGTGNRVAARGVACAEKRSRLDEIRLITERDGKVVRVLVEIPDASGWNNGARLDLDVEVPAGIPVEIEDSSGDIDIRGVTLARIEDSSGDVDARDTAGDVEIDDSSGDVYLTGHRGRVTLSDSSGDLRLKDIEGSVLVDNDSSGDISADRVSGSVIVRRDSSGDIRVSDVGGDFEVRRDGSGDIEYRDVRGRVDVPAED